MINSKGLTKKETNNLKSFLDCKTAEERNNKNVVCFTAEVNNKLNRLKQLLKQTKPQSFSAYECEPNV